MHIKKFIFLIFLINFFLIVANTSFSQNYPTPLGSTEVGQALHNDLNGSGKWNQISFADETTQTTAATGDVVGPASATDNAIARFDLTTGKLLQNSGTILDDSNNLSGIPSLTYAGTFTLTATDSALNVVVGTGIGDDFTINASGFVYEGDTGNIGIGTTTPISFASQKTLHIKQGGTNDALAIIQGGSNAANAGHIRLGGGSSALNSLQYINNLSIATITDLDGTGFTEQISLDNNGTTSFKDNNITNVGDIALDTISSDGATSPLTITATAGQAVTIEGVSVDGSVITGATSADIGGTTLLASRSLAIDTGGVFDINMGTASGDDFTVDTSAFVVEGDTGNVGIGTTVPNYLLDIYSNDIVGNQLKIRNLSGGSNATPAHSKIQFTSANDTYQLGYIDYTSRSANSVIGQAKFVVASNIVTPTYTEVLHLNGDGNVGIGTTGPGSKLDVTTAGLGTTQTTSSGLALVNTTAAAVGAQQISPAVRWSGYGWKTDATAASQAVDFRSFVVPVQGAANPTGYLSFGSSINGAAYNDGQMVLSSDGNVGIGTVSPGAELEVNGSISTSVDSNTIADTGDANPATATLTPTTSYVELTCNDADTCDITLGETGIDEGERVTIVNVSANICDFADTATVSELAGAFAMGQYDSLSLIYIGDRWVERGRSNN